MARKRSASLTVNSNIRAAEKAVQAAYAALQVQPKRTGAGFTGRVALSSRSWGEVIDVTLRPEGQTTTIEISSRCVLPTQFIDFGKNQDNIDTMVAAIESRKVTSD